MTDNPYKKVKKKGQNYISAYDKYWEDQPYWSLELQAARYFQGIEEYNQATECMIKAKNIIWPETAVTTHSWAYDKLRAHYDGHKIITLAGGASTGKSFDMAWFSILWWLQNPSERGVIIGSTTLTALEQRIWGYVHSLYIEAQNRIGLPGFYTSSKPPRIRISKHKTVECIQAAALVAGSSEKTMANLIGIHPKNGLLVIVDEGTDVSPGFIGAVDNWERGTDFFQMWVIGNSNSKLDPHGLMSTPAEGWDNIHPDTHTEWKTKHGLCLYFDCYNSPAITETDPKKKEALGRFLATESMIEEKEKLDGKDSPGFWRFMRGFWPPDDQDQTILSESMVNKFNVRRSTEWSGEFLTTLAGLDPAFGGGDNCILRFADFGIDVDGRYLLDFGGEKNIESIKLDVKSKEPITYQIVEKVMELCKRHYVDPENLAVDVVNEGAGIGDVFERVWSPDIYKVSSRGSASDLFVDAQKKKKAKDEYDRRITELWFSIQKFVRSRQIRGLDEVTLSQFCTRLYNWKGKKICIETKDEYKLRMGKIDSRYQSPDHADAATFILDLARNRYGFIPDKVDEYSEEWVPWSIKKKKVYQDEVDHQQNAFTEYEAEGFTEDYSFTEDDLWEMD